MANVFFKTSTNKTIDDLFIWTKSSGMLEPNYNEYTGVPFSLGTVYFTSDGYIVFDTKDNLGNNKRIWMGKNAYSAIYAEDISETHADIANTYLKRTGGLLEGSGTAATSASEQRSGDTSAATYYYPAVWRFNIAETPKNGDIIVIKTPVAGHDNGVFISIDYDSSHPEQAHYQPVLANGTSRLANQYEAGTSLILIYEANTAVSQVYNVEGSKARVNITGAWRVLNYYDSTNIYQLRTGCARVLGPSTGDSTATKSLYKFEFLIEDKNGLLIPFGFQNDKATTYNKALTTASFNPFSPIFYYFSTTTVNVGSNIAAHSLYGQTIADCRYSFNINAGGTAGSTAFTTNLPIYIKALYNYSTGTATFVQNISSSNYLERSSLTQNLPTTNPNINLPSGQEYIYIQLGNAYSKHQVDLNAFNKVVYHWDSINNTCKLFTPVAVTNNTINLTRNTETTIATINNTPIKIKLPASDNTDYKVRQTPINSNDNNNYRILLSNSANDTSEDSISKKNANLIYNPTENKLSTGNIKLTGELDVTGNVYLRNQTAVDNLTTGGLIVNGNSTFNNDINFAQGAVKWTSNSLPAVTSADYFLVIDGFANGGATKYITKANAIKSLINSSAIGSSTKPVYWTGSAFSAITSYSGAAALTGTPTAPTAAAGTSTTQIATTEFVNNAVTQGFVANDAMVFKGLIGSNQPITQLPTSGYNAGWTYRVANAGIFAGEYCEVGDLLIAINDGPASGSSVINADWGKVEHNIDGAVFRGSGASNSSVGSSTQPVYVNGSGIVTAITGAIANDTTGNAATASVASKLSNTSAIGSSTQPVYFNSSGQPVAVNKYDQQTGKTTDFVPYVKSDGVMEIGKYIDFHNTSEDTSGYIVRITARDSSETNGAGLTLTGTTVGTFKGNLNGTATKATQDGNGNVITSTYLPLSGGTMTGNLQWNGLTALPSTTTTDYFLAIDAFANGGTTKYITKENALKSLISSSSIGTSLRPVYWTGSSFSQVNWFPSYCTVNGDNKNNYNYRRIATLSIGGSTWVDKDAVLVIRSRYNTSNYGIVKISGRATNNQGPLDLSAYWLIRSGFEEDSILICRKRETTDTSLGDTQVDVYLKTPIAYPRIYVYMLVGSSHLNGFQLINSEEKKNSVLSYNTSDAENPNVIDINNSDLKGSYEVYIRDKDENGNLLNSFSGYNPNNSNSQTTPTAQSQVYTHIKTALDAGSVSRAKKSSLISTNQNAIVYYTDTTGTFGQKASANGTLYATSANGSLQWGTLPMAQGGTGATTAAGARTNLGLGTMATEAANNYIAKSVGTAKGDIIYWSAANTPARLNIGSVGQVLKVSSNGIPVWSNESIIGVKGNAEDNYRTGNVNITPANILGSSSTAKFWRGDNTWSNMLEQTTATTLGINTSDLRIGRAIRTLHIATSDNGTGAGVADGQAAGITFGVSNAAYAGIYYQSSNGYGSRLCFATTRNFGNGAYARMVITRDGNVGIGTLSPSTLLHVAGDVTVTGLNASQAVATDANKKLVSADLYWANIKATLAASYNKTPEVANIKLNGNISATAASTKNVQLVYDTSLETLNFVFS